MTEAWRWYRRSLLAQSAWALGACALSAWWGWHEFGPHPACFLGFCSGGLLADGLAKLGEHMQMHLAMRKVIARAVAPR